MQDHGSHQRIEKMIAFTLLPMEVLISAVIALHAWDASEISANGHSEPPRVRGLVPKSVCPTFDNSTIAVYSSEVFIGSTRHAWQ